MQLWCRRYSAAALACEAACGYHDDLRNSFPVPASILDSRATKRGVRGKQHVVDEREIMVVPDLASRAHTLSGQVQTPTVCAVKRENSSGTPSPYNLVMFLEELSKSIELNCTVSLELPIARANVRRRASNYSGGGGFPLPLTSSTRPSTRRPYFWPVCTQRLPYVLVSLPPPR